MNINESNEAEPQAAVACTDLLDALDAIKQAHDDADRKLHNLLRTRGWKYTSDTPGCFWLWEKQLPDGRTLLLTAKMAVTCERMIDSSNSMFGPKSPAERAAPRDSVISWANHETVGGDCQYVNFGQKVQPVPIHEGPGGSEALARRMPRRWLNLAPTLSPALPLTPKGSSNTADAPAGSFEDNNPPSGASRKKHQ